MKWVQVQLSRQLHSRLKIRCVELGTTMNEVLVLLVQLFCDRCSTLEDIGKLMTADLDDARKPDRQTHN